MREMNMVATGAQKRSSWVNPEFKEEFLEMTTDGYK